MNTTAVAANVVTVLQASYKGRLAIMVPRSPSTVSPRWMAVYVWQVVELCDRHNRTEEQVMAALTTVLAK